MSVQTALQFFDSEAVAKPALQQKLVAAVKGKEGMAAATAASALGHDHGFEFTPEEAMQARQITLVMLKQHAIRKGEMPDAELTTEELDLIAGGWGLLPPPSGPAQNIATQMAMSVTNASGPGPIAAITVANQAVDTNYAAGTSPVNSEQIWDKIGSSIAGAFSGW